MTRSCYERACRWYVDGPIGRIRYYFVPGTNHFLPGVNVFLPKSQWEPGEYWNENEPGEIASARRAYSKGNNPRPDLDGSHPIGTADEFAGLAAVPTPFPGPIACRDMPGFLCYVAVSSIHWIGRGAGGALGFGLQTTTIHSASPANSGSAYGWSAAYAGYPLGGSYAAFGSAIWSGNPLPLGGAGYGGGAAEYWRYGSAGGCAYNGGSPNYWRYISAGGCAFDGSSATFYAYASAGGCAFDGSSATYYAYASAGGCAFAGSSATYYIYPSAGGCAYDGSAAPDTFKPDSGGCAYTGSAASYYAYASSGGCAYDGSAVTYYAYASSGGCAYDGDASQFDRYASAGGASFDGTAAFPGPVTYPVFEQAQVAGNAVTSRTVTVSTLPAVGNTLLLWIAGKTLNTYDGITVKVSDNKGGLWLPFTGITDGATGLGIECVARAVPSSITGTFTITYTQTSSAQLVIYYQEWYKNATAETVHTSSGTSTTPAGGSLTTTHTGVWVNAFMADNAGNTVNAAPTGYDIQFVETGLTNIRVKLCRKHLGAVATENPAFSISTSVKWVAMNLPGYGS